MSKWTLGSYNRFIGRAMKSYGLTRRQAAEMYRGARGREGKPVYRSYIDRHPRIAKKLAERSILRRPPIEKPPRKIKDMIPVEPEEFEELQEELDDDQEAESSEDYGESET